MLFYTAQFFTDGPGMSDLDLLMQNARLRDEMEPFLDESVYLVDLDKMDVRKENDFLTSLLAWEKAPVLPISQWFEPALVCLLYTSPSPRD